MLRARGAFPVLLLVAGAAFGLAQEDAPDEPAKEAQPPAADARPLEKLIYVPYRDLKAALGNVDRTIFLPYSEYLDLVKRADEAARERRMDRPAAVVTSSRYLAKVEDDHVRITAQFEIEALDGPWTEVPVAFGTAAVGKITTPEGKPPVLLRGLGQGRYAFVLPEKGTHAVEVELLARVRSSPDGRRFELGVPSVAVTTLELEIPVADQEVTVEPDAVVRAANGNDGAKSTRVRADVGSATNLAVRWRPRAGLEPDMDLLAGVENTLQITFADRLVQARAILRYRVLRGELPVARIAVPKGHRVLDVVSPDVELKGWTTADEANRTVVTATLLSPARKPFALEVRTEGPLPDETFAVAGLAEDGTARGIHALDVVRESGRLVVVPARESNLVVERSTGLVRVEAADVPEELRFARGQFFRFFDAKFDLDVALQAIEPRIVVETYATVALLEDRIETATTFRETIERAGVFERTYEIPAGHEIVDVQGPQRRDHTFDAASRVLKVALLERFEGTHELVVRTRRAFEAKARQDALALTIPQPTGVDRETGRVDVLSIPGVAVRTDEAKLVGLVPEALAARANVDGASTVSSWSFNRRPFELTVGTLQRPTRISATVGTTLDVKRDTARVTSRLSYSVEYAAVDELRFAVPEPVAAGIAVTNDRGEPVDWRPAAAIDGWVPVRVRLDHETLGNVVLLVEYDLAPGGDAVPEPRAPPAADAAPAPANGAAPPAPVDAPPVDDVDPAAPKPDDAKVDAPPPAADAPPADGAPPAVDPGDAVKPAGNGRPAGNGQPGDNAKPAGNKEPAPEAIPVGERFVLQPPQALGLLDADGKEMPLAQVRGEIVVVKERMLSVSPPKMAGADIEAIDVRELEFHAAGDAFLAFRYVAQPVTLTLFAAVHEIEEVVETVVTRALVEVVTSRDDKATYRCRYRILSSQRQRLSIGLPKETEIIGAFLSDPEAPCPNGHCVPQRVDLERDATSKDDGDLVTYTVSVARRAGSDVPFQLVLLLRPALAPAPFATRGGRLQLTLPRIGGANTPVQQLRTLVYVPDEFSLVGTPQNFVNESREWFPGTLFERSQTWVDVAEQQRWIGGSAVDVYDFTPQGRAYLYSSVGGADELVVQWWHMPFVTWVLTGMLLVVGFVLRNTSWENKLGLVVLGALLLAVYALADRESALQLLIAARFGLIAIAALWLIHGLVSLPAAWRAWRAPGRPLPLGTPVAVVSPPPEGGSA